MVKPAVSLQKTLLFQEKNSLLLGGHNGEIGHLISENFTVSRKKTLLLGGQNGETGRLTSENFTACVSRKITETMDMHGPNPT